MVAEGKFKEYFEGSFSLFLTDLNTLYLKKSMKQKNIVGCHICLQMEKSTV